MFKIINTLVFSVIATVALSANVQAQEFTFTPTKDDMAAEVKAAASRYTRDRIEYGADMMHLIKADKGEVLHRQARGDDIAQRKAEQAEIDFTMRRAFKNEVIFNTARAPEESLRSVGMANDLRSSKMPGNYWLFSREPKEFVAIYGKPAYAVNLGNGLCALSLSMYTSYYQSERSIGTYVDLDKEGQVVEIHVTTCEYMEGPLEGTSVISEISPVMKGVNFIARFATQERRVLNSTIGIGKE